MACEIPLNLNGINIIYILLGWVVFRGYGKESKNFFFSYFHYKRISKHFAICNMASKQLQAKNQETRIKHVGYLLVGCENIYGFVVGCFMKSL